MPTRMIKDSIRTSPTLAGLSAEAERLFYRLLTTADDFGRFEATPAIVRAACFPLLLDQIPESCLTFWILELANERDPLIALYDVKNRRYGVFLKASEYFRRRSANAKYPEPPDNICQQMTADRGHVTSDARDLRSRDVKCPSDRDRDRDRDRDLFFSKNEKNTPLSSSPGELDLCVRDLQLSVQEPAPQAPVPGTRRAVRARVPAADVQAVYAHYRTHHPRSHPAPRRDSREWRAIADRLGEGYTVDELKRAIDGNHRSAFHCGSNPRNRKFHSLELIFRSASHVAQFVEALEQAERLDQTPDEMPF